MSEIESLSLGRLQGFTGARMWIGINDRGSPGRWQWSNDDPVAFFNWQSGN